jgi:hypothetical protein
MINLSHTLFSTFCILFYACNGVILLRNEVEALEALRNVSRKHEIMKPEAAFLKARGDICAPQN